MVLTVWVSQSFFKLTWRPSSYPLSLKSLVLDSSFRSTCSSTTAFLRRSNFLIIQRFWVSFALPVVEGSAIISSERLTYPSAIFYVLSFLWVWLVCLIQVPKVPSTSYKTVHFSMTPGAQRSFPRYDLINTLSITLKLRIFWFCLCPSTSLGGNIASNVVQILLPNIALAKEFPSGMIELSVIP